MPAPNRLRQGADTTARPLLIQNKPAHQHSSAFTFHKDIFTTGHETTPRTVAETLALNKEFAAYRQEGFRQPMDTLRDEQLLESLWQWGNPPWKNW